MMVWSATPRFLLGAAITVAAVAGAASAGCPSAPDALCSDGCAGWQTCSSPAAAGLCIRRPECIYFATGADMGAGTGTGCEDRHDAAAGQVCRTMHPGWHWALSRSLSL